MPFNISTYKTKIAKDGYLFNNRFRVIVTSPPVLQNAGNQIPSMFQFRADSVKAPGVTLNADDVYRHGIGIKESMPFSASYTTNTISFISDGRGDIWTYWYLWMNSIFDFGGVDNGLKSNSNQLPTYQVEYKDNYATMMSVEIFDNFGYKIQTINMYDAFPISINDVPLNWGNNNQLLRVTVGISFKEMTVQGAEYVPPQKNIPPLTPNAPSTATTPLNTGKTVLTPSK